MGVIVLRFSTSTLRTWLFEKRSDQSRVVGADRKNILSYAESVIPEIEKDEQYRKDHRFVRQTWGIGNLPTSMIEMTTDAVKSGLLLTAIGFYEPLAAIPMALAVGLSLIHI